jgi:hypothetical protein
MPPHPGHPRPDPHSFEQRDQRVNQVQQRQHKDADAWQERQRRLKALKKKVDLLGRELRDDGPHAGSVGAVGRKEVKKQSEAKSQQLLKLVKSWKELGGKMDNAHLKGGGEMVAIIIVIVTISHALWPKAQALAAGLLHWTDAKLDRVLGRMREIDRDLKQLQ